MRLRSLAVLAACLVALVAAATASAKGPVAGSLAVTTTATSIDRQTVSIFGYLTSPNPKCLGGRTIKFTTHYADDSRRYLDTVRTSAHGYFGAGGPASGASIHEFIYRIPAKRFGPRRHRRTCAAINGSWLLP